MNGIDFIPYSPGASKESGVGRETKSNKGATRACQSMSESSNMNWVIGTGYPLNKHEILTLPPSRQALPLLHGGQ